MPAILGEVPDAPQHKSTRDLLLVSARRRAEVLRARMDARAPLQELIFHLWSMKDAGHSEQVLELLREVARRYHPQEAASLALLEAELLTDAGRWEEALGLLSREDVRALDPDGPRVQHVAHLRGTVLLHLGDEAGARDAWDEGVQLEGDCGLFRCLNLVDPLPEPPPEEWGLETELQQLRSAVQVSDARRSRGDVEGALRAIEHWTVHAAGELQSAARLAELHLLQPDSIPEASFRKAVALSYLVEVHGGGSAWELPLGAERWSRERIGGVVQWAARWLEGPQRGEP
jgi:tetratricopeptide (TPR) repeat protein